MDFFFHEGLPGSRFLLPEDNPLYRVSLLMVTAWLIKHYIITKVPELSNHDGIGKEKAY